MTYSKYAQTGMTVDLKQYSTGSQKEYVILQQIPDPGSCDVPVSAGTWSCVDKRRR